MQALELSAQICLGVHMQYDLQTGGREWERWGHKLRSEVGFHVEGNSSLAEKNVTWETNFMIFEFVM